MMNVELLVMEQSKLTRASGDAKRGLGSPHLNLRYPDLDNHSQSSVAVMPTRLTKTRKQ